MKEHEEKYVEKKKLKEFFNLLILQRKMWGVLNWVLLKVIQITSQDQD